MTHELTNSFEVGEEGDEAGTRLFSAEDEEGIVVLILKMMMMSKDRFVK
jgi:hypothetical protein